MFTFDGGWIAVVVQLPTVERTETSLLGSKQKELSGGTACLMTPEGIRSAVMCGRSMCGLACICISVQPAVSDRLRCNEKVQEVIGLRFVQGIVL